MAGTHRVKITRADFAEAWWEFNSGPEKIDLIALGSPHFSLEETRAFANLMKGRHKHPNVSVIITLGRDVLAKAETEGLVNQLREVGVQFFSDLCWCSIVEPVFPRAAETLMTNSGKYAHYAPGLCGRNVRYGSLNECAQAAESGAATMELPVWLN